MSRPATSLPRLVREGYRNFVADTTRGAVVVGLSTLLLVVLVAAEAAQFTDVVREERDFRDRGGYTFRLDSVGSDGQIPERGTIDGPACERLSRLPGVVAAGVFVSTGGQLATSLSRQTRFDHHVATPNGVRALAGPDVDAAGAVLLGREAHLLAAAGAGDLVQIATAAGDRTLSVAGVLDEPSMSGLELAVVEIVSVPPLARSCVVRTRPSSYHQLRDAAAAVVTDDPATVQVADIVFRGAFVQPPLQRYRVRPTALAWIVAGGLLGLMGTAVHGLRRSDMGLYRALGARRGDVAVVLAVESALGMAAGLSVAVAVAWLLHNTVAQGSLALSVITVSRAAAVAAATIVVAIPAAVRGHAADQLKDR